MRYLSVRIGVTAAILLVAATAIAPGQFGSPFGGPPLSEAARWILVGLLWLSGAVALFPPRHAPPLSLLALLLCCAGGQVWLGQTSPTRGWFATYEMRDAPPARARFAWRYRTHDFRVDPAIDFGGPSFGLHFLNDLERYGQKYHRQHSRDTEVPLRVTWRGIARLTEPSPIAVTAGAAGAISVSVNGRPLFVAPGPVTQASAASVEPVPDGIIQVEVVYDKPANIRPAAHVRLTTPNHGDLDVGPFGPPTSNPPRRDHLEASTFLVIAALGLLAAVVVVTYRPVAVDNPLGVAPSDFVARSAILTAFGVLLYLDGMAVIPRLRDTVYLWAGDDPLAYVSNARNILLEGWLMAGGKPLGEGAPFYFYPLFGYVVGLAHWVIGEDFAVVQLVNGWSVAAVLPLAYALGWHARRWWATVLGAGAMYWLVDTHMMPYAKAGFTDSVFTGLVFVTLVLCRQGVRASAGWAAVAGVSCALAAAARPSFLTFTPLFVVAILLFGRYAGIRSPFRVACAVLAGFAVGLLPFALRNLIVSGKFVVLVNSWIQLPYFLIPPDTGPNPVPAMFTGIPTLMDSLAAVVQLVAADPGGVLLLEVRKVLFTLGFMQFGAAGVQPHPEFVMLSALFLMAAFTRRLPRDVLFVTAVFTLSHIAAMVLAAPWTYGYKSILPLQAVFLFGAVFLLPGAAVLPPPTSVPSEVPHVARP